MTDRFRVKIGDVTDGTRLMADDHFSCIPEHEIVTVRTTKVDGTRKLFVRCADGQHLLDGQEDGDEYVGFRMHAR